MKYRICAVTGGRADYGPLRNTLLRLRDNAETELDLLVTGTHLLEDFGNTQTEIAADGFAGYSKLYLPFADDSKEGMAVSTGEAMTGFAKHFSRTRPDLVLLLGDRFEIFAAAAAAQLMCIPIAHISGGDVTEGAVDDAIRNCITKMSSLHFPGCEQSAKRIVQMGEAPETVFNVGEPGVENCLKMKKLSRGELAEQLGFDGIRGDYAVVTFHPVTRDAANGTEQLEALLRAMEEVDELSYIVTLSNADSGGQEINARWREEGKKHGNWLVVPSLGALRYISLMQHCAVVIGNSSSGVFEAPALGVATVNIGDRQKGRMMAQSVISCKAQREEIVRAIRLARSEEHRQKCVQGCSFYGDGRTSELIESTVLRFLKEGRLCAAKHFYDIEFGYEGR